MFIFILLIGGAMASGQDFSQLVSSDWHVEKLATDMKFIEGPVWMPAGFLVFSDTPGNQLKKWSAKKGLEIFRDQANNPNGNTLDTQGRLVTCEDGLRRVSVTEADGTIRNVVDRYQGKRFNSPNDIVVKSDGTIWFTDPDYNVPKGEKRELDHKSIYRFDPKTKNLTVVAGADFDMPNGLCFSLDEKKLYIADSGKPHHIRVFDVQEGGTLSGGEVFCVISPGIPDGFRIDEFGNIWTSAGDGVHVFSPAGKLLGKIPVPQTPSNLCFGGSDGRTLFITARSSLYSIKVNVRGAVQR
jgi:gluconolactonase